VCFLISLVLFRFLGVFRAVAARDRLRGDGKESIVDLEDFGRGSLSLSLSLSLCLFEHLIVTTRNLRYSCDRCIFLYRVDDSEKGLGCFVESI